MAHIPTQPGLPGISSLFAFRPETAKPMRELAHVLLYSESSLSSGDREVIATYVSSRNQCVFCTQSHAAAARAHLKEDASIVDDVLLNGVNASVSDKLKSLLTIAGKVQKGGRIVTDEDVALAKSLGATDMEIHDTVLIAAAFSMFNRYVDGLASFTPQDPADYVEMGVRMASVGYIPPKS
ncbi:MAG: peroxidase-related enzyme [Candidatus Kapabacteria bacterium]|jgi:uncharacterized peroxidase-related enzyme|nr:peroxidase-related enzyme [Candidatus Kapabacteria bacterium]